MLEPTVRPGGVGVGAGQQAGKPAFEKRSFEDLLNEAAPTAAENTKANSPSGDKANALDALSGLGRIENAALRQVLAQARQSGKGSADSA